MRLVIGETDWQAIPNFQASYKEISETSKKSFGNLL